MILEQKELFRIGSKPALFYQFEATRKESFVIYFMKKCGEITVDNRCPFCRHGPLSGETFQALGFRTGDYWKVSHESKVNPLSPTKLLGP